MDGDDYRYRRTNRTQNELEQLNGGPDWQRSKEQDTLEDLHAGPVLLTRLSSHSQTRSDDTEPGPLEEYSSAARPFYVAANGEPNRNIASVNPPPLVVLTVILAGILGARATLFVAVMIFGWVGGRDRDPECDCV